MEIGQTEALIGLLLAFASFIGAIAIAVRLAARQLDKSFELLRGELADEKKRTDAQAEEIATLKNDLQAREERLEKVSRDLDTALDQLRDLQQWKTLAQNEIDNKDRRIKELTTERDMCKSQAERAFESAKQWQLKHDTLADILTRAAAVNAKESEETPPKSATVADLTGGEETQNKPEEA